MKKNQEIKELYNTFVKHVNNLDSELQEHLKKIKLDNKDLILHEKKKLLAEISKGENLNYKLLKKKYLSILPENNIESDSDNESPVLNKTIINDIDYYYENKENGNIYNMNTEIVGSFINKKFIIN
jgi:hypothetical protein